MEYFISINNEKRGPYTLNELKERGLEATTLVMPAEGGNWTPAWQIDELRPVLMEDKPAESTTKEEPISPQDALETGASEEPQVAQESIEEAIPFVKAQPIYNNEEHTNTPPPAYDAPKKKKGHGCLIAVIAALVIFIVALIVTCPSEQAHKDAISNVATQTLDDAQAEAEKEAEDDFSKAFSKLFIASIEQVAHAVINNMVKVDNYGVCSVGKIHYGGKDKVVSVGVLGHIFTVDKDDVEQEINRKLKEEANSPGDNSIKQGIKGLVEKGVLDPLGKAIKGLVGSAIDGVVDEVSKSAKEVETEATDSI